MVRGSSPARSFDARSIERYPPPPSGAVHITSGFLREGARMSTLLPSRAAIRIVPVVALVLALGASALGSSAVSATVVVTRQAGADPTATAVSISAATFAAGVPVVYMAASGDMPYALPANAAAGALHGPVLLTTKDTLPAAVSTELSRLHPARIVVVGDTSHVSDAVLTKLRSYAAAV